MALKRIVKIDTGSISAGGFVDISYAPEVDLRLKKIRIVEASGNTIYNVTMTLRMGDKPYVDPDVSASLFVGDYDKLMTLDIDHPAGVKLSSRVTNSESAARRLFIHLIYEE